MGAKRFERVLALRPEVGVDLRWRPFQLQPHMPAGGLPWREFAKAKFGGEEGARGAFARVTSVGASEGITFDFDRVASAPNTVDAHRVILHAARYALQWKTANALFAAYFSDGSDLNDHEQLVDIASDAGLDAGEVRSVIVSGEGTEEVHASQEEAARLGISGVPSTSSTAATPSRGPSRPSCSFGRSIRHTPKGRRKPPTRTRRGVRSTRGSSVCGERGPAA